MIKLSQYSIGVSIGVLIFGSASTAAVWGLIAVYFLLAARGAK